MGKLECEATRDTNKLMHFPSLIERQDVHGFPARTQTHLRQMALRLLLQEQHDGIREPADHQRKQQVTDYNHKNPLSWYLLTPGTTDYTRWLKPALLLLLLLLQACGLHNQVTVNKT